MSLKINLSPQHYVATPVIYIFTGDLLKILSPIIRKQEKKNNIESNIESLSRSSAYKDQFCKIELKDFLHDPCH